MASPGFKNHPAAGACALGPARARPSGHSWGRRLRRRRREDARAAPGPSPSSAAADCGCCVCVSVRVAARPRGECSGGPVECQAGQVRGPRRLSGRPQPRLDPWRRGQGRPLPRGRPGAGPRVGARLSRRPTCGRKCRWGALTWQDRWGRGAAPLAPATKHRLSGSVCSPSPPPAIRVSPALFDLG